MPINHLSHERIAVYLADRLDEEQASEVDAHLAICDGDCVDRLKLIEDEDWLDSHGAEIPVELQARLNEISRARRMVRKNPANHQPPEIEGYRILGFVGEGGMGTVWAAFDPRSGQAVALKVIAEREFATQQDIDRFRHEAEIARDLSRSDLVDDVEHASVVPIYEFAVSGGVAYIAMDLIEHGTLADHLEELSTDLKETARIFEQIARAVDRPHKLVPPLIHRDIKPTNILLGLRRGVPKGGAVTLFDLYPLLTDFGLAKRQGEAGFSETGVIIGTLDYMAPEQVASGSKPTPAMDISALGATLYHCLAQRPPFRHESEVQKTLPAVEILDRVRFRFPTPPSGSVTPKSRDLWTICLKCLEKNPRRRYLDASALADDLARFRQDQPIRAIAPGALRRGVRWSKSNPTLSRRLLAGAVATISIVLGLLAVVGVLVVRDARKSQAFAASAAETSRKLAESENEIRLFTEAELATTGIGRSMQQDLRAVAGQFKKLNEFPTDAAVSTEVVGRIGEILEHLASELERGNSVWKDSMDKRGFASLIALAQKVEDLSRLDPEPSKFDAKLLTIYCGLAHSLTNRDEARSTQMEALSWSDKSEVLLSSDLPSRDLKPELLAEVKKLRWAILTRLGRYTEALVAFTEAIQFAPELTTQLPGIADEAARPNAEAEQSQLPWSRGPSADHAKAVALAEFLASYRGVRDAAVYNAACALALASLDKTADEAERKRRENQAWSFLERILANGYFKDPLKLDELSKDLDFESLHVDPKFEKLIEAAKAFGG